MNFNNLLYYAYRDCVTVRVYCIMALWACTCVHVYHGMCIRVGLCYTRACYTRQEI